MIPTVVNQHAAGETTLKAKTLIATRLGLNYHIKSIAFHIVQANHAILNLLDSAQNLPNPALRDLL
jgi:hypothetical protein